MPCHPLLAAYRPSSSDPFDAVKAAHLYNRAGFGATPEDIRQALGIGLGATVDRLLGFPDKAAGEQGDDVPNLSGLEEYPDDYRRLRQLLAGKSKEEQQQLHQKIAQANRQAMVEIAYWWLKRMGGGPYPLQEKLTLFWHGHFTTSAKEQRSARLIWRQNELLRQMAGGSFADFVLAISRDPAMLDYLNNQQNRKQHPNENYARELMELFTLGIGHYTETDVKEAARAFTGWGHEAGQFIFRANAHDFGPKIFLGQAGPWDGGDIIAIILRRPECGHFIGQKLYRFFVDDQVDAALAQALGQVLTDHDYQLRPLLRMILCSKAFFSPQVIGTQIKSPIQLVVETVRLLKLELPHLPRIEYALNQMGQAPLSPPNVKGWPGGRLWINTSTLLIRNNTLLWLSGDEAKRPVTWPRQFLAGATTPADAVDELLSRLIQRPVDRGKREVLVDAMGPSVTAASVRHVAQLILTMPEYQLC